MGLLFKSKKEKEQDKEINEYLKEYEKIEESSDEKFNVMTLFEKDPVEEELKEYMTKEQIEEEKRDKKNNLVLIIISSSIMTFSLIIGLIIIMIITYNRQDELHKTVIKDLRTYYNDKYNTHVSIDDIKYICYTDQEKKEACTDIIYAKTNNNHVIIKHGDELGDDNNTSSIYNEYKQELLQYISSDNLITNNPTISYSNFYNIYYPYVDYIKVLPNKSYNDLKQGKKLTLRDFIIYQGEIDANIIKSFIDTLNDNSEIILLQTNKGIPINIKIVNHFMIRDINILTQSYLDDGIVYYQLDSSANNTSAVNLTKVATTSIKPIEEGTTFSNTYQLKVDKIRSSKDDPINRDILASYYLLSFNNLSDENVIQFNGLNELKKEDYKYLYYINGSNKTYIFTYEDISIGNASYNKKK